MKAAPRKTRQKKRSPERGFKVFSILVLIFIGGLLIWLVGRRVLDEGRRYDLETSFTVYSSFGIPIPDGYSIHGIDVSRYQQRVNWTLVRQMRDSNLHIRFAFIKATEGASLTDRQFGRNWRNSRRAGISRGAYHYFLPGVSGRTQALHFIREVELQPGDLPPVLDVEARGGDGEKEFLKEVETWLALVEIHYRVKPILYTNASFYESWLGRRFADYPLWVAHYQEPVKPRVNRSWLFWQHSESGRVNGIEGPVDFNVFQGDETSFSSLLYKGNNLPSIR
jgi:lysozyme